MLNNVLQLEDEVDCMEVCVNSAKASVETLENTLDALMKEL